MAKSTWAVQMFDVAFARRMCCSRVWKASTYPRFPSRSTVSPTIRVPITSREVVLDEPASARGLVWVLFPNHAEESELLLLHRTDFYTVIGENPGISTALIKVLSARLRRANHQISTLALLDVYGRVARVILDMAREEGRRLKDGRIAFRRATHQEIANRIGASREMVARILKDLQTGNYISIDGKRLTINEKLPDAW